MIERTKTGKATARKTVEVPSILQTMARTINPSRGIAVTETAQDRHIHISSEEGKLAYHSAQWMAPKTLPTMDSVIPGMSVYLPSSSSASATAQNEGTEFE